MDDVTFAAFDFTAPSDEHGQKAHENKRAISVHRGGKRQLTRKAASESALESAIDWHFRDGDCYHCFSFGDVDSLTFFKHVLRQQKIEYAAISTWCMAGEDVRDLAEWHRRGLLGRVDLLVGEIFRGSYPEVYEEANRFLADCGGRMVIFRNHAKVMVILGERFDCLIESSANVNTNPRSENTVITVDRELAGYYKELFDGIRSFERGYDNIKPFERG